VTSSSSSATSSEPAHQREPEHDRHPVAPTDGMSASEASIMRRSASMVIGWPGGATAGAGRVAAVPAEHQPGARRVGLVAVAGGAVRGADGGDGLLDRRGGAAGVGEVCRVKDVLRPGTAVSLFQFGQPARMSV
jgi:hypothetical protein